jgi:hypothetical protein
MAAYLRNKLHADQAAERLEALDNVVARGNLVERDGWARSMYDRMHIDGIVEGVRLRKTTPWWLMVLEVFRNVLVLVPLVLTWFGISRAIDANYRYLSGLALGSEELKAAQQSSFVFLWEGGFGGYLAKVGGIKLSTLALYDFFLLAALVGLAFAVALITNWHNNWQEHKAEDLREELTQILYDASRELTTSSGGQSIDTILQGLVLELGRIGGLFAQMVQQQAAIQGYGDALKTSATTLSTAIGQLQASSTQMAQSSAEIAQNVVVLTGAVTKLDGQQTQLLQSMQTVAQQQVQVIQYENQMMLDQRATLDQLTQLVGGASVKMDAMTQSLQTLDQTARAAVQQFAAVQGEASGVAGLLSDIVQEQKRYKVSMEEHLKAQQALIAYLGQIAQPAANAISNIEIVMRGVWAEANRTVQVLATVAPRLQGAMTPILQEHQEAARSLVAAANRLNGRGHP